MLYDGIRSSLLPGYNRQMGEIYGKESSETMNRNDNSSKIDFRSENCPYKGICTEDCPMFYDACPYYNGNKRLGDYDDRNGK